MADTGPCGPCSELHFDQGPSVPGDAVPNGEGDRVIEIWNLVFMQFNRDCVRSAPSASQTKHRHRHGPGTAGRGRAGALSNYDSDLFTPILAAIGKRAGRSYGEQEAADRSMRVMADHLRAITFLMADGVLPSNEGRGYVLRRILRRAARHGRLLGIVDPFLHDLTATVVEDMGQPISICEPQPARWPRPQGAKKNDSLRPSIRVCRFSTRCSQRCAARADRYCPEPMYSNCMIPMDFRWI